MCLCEVGGLYGCMHVCARLGELWRKYWCNFRVTQRDTGGHKTECALSGVTMDTFGPLACFTGKTPLFQCRTLQNEECHQEIPMRTTSRAGIDPHSTVHLLIWVFLFVIRLTRCTAILSCGLHLLEENDGPNI